MQQLAFLPFCWCKYNFLLFTQSVVLGLWEFLNLLVEESEILYFWTVFMGPMLLSFATVVMFRGEVVMIRCYGVIKHFQIAKCSYYLACYSNFLLL